MKHIIAIFMAAAIAFSASAADNKAKEPANETAKWIDSITLAPVGAIKTRNLDGPSQWGAGFILGANVNPFVRIEVQNLSFEGEGESTSHTMKDGKKTKGTTTTGEDSWGGLLVDETAVQVDAKISRFSNETFSLHLVSGGQTDWNDNDYGINAGLKVELAFSKRFSASAGYSIRTWFKGDTRVDSLATAQLNFSF
jgi:hypothetical protein